MNEGKLEAAITVLGYTHYIAGMLSGFVCLVALQTGIVSWSHAGWFTAFGVAVAMSLMQAMFRDLRRDIRDYRELCDSYAEICRQLLEVAEQQDAKERS